VPIPFGAAYLGSLVRRAGLADFSTDQLSFLSYGRGLDTTRMREVMKFTPRNTTREAFLDFADHVPPVLPGADAAASILGRAAGSAVHVAGGLVGRVRQVAG